MQSAESDVFHRSAHFCAARAAFLCAAQKVSPVRGRFSGFCLAFFSAAVGTPLADSPTKMEPRNGTSTRNGKNASGERVESPTTHLSHGDTYDNSYERPLDGQDF